MRVQDLDADPGIVHLSRDLSADPTNKLHVVREVDADCLHASFRAFVGGEIEAQVASPVAVYEHEDMPGRALTCNNTKDYHHNCDELKAQATLNLDLT